MQVINAICLLANTFTSWYCSFHCAFCNALHWRHILDYNGSAQNWWKRGLVLQIAPWFKESGKELVQEPELIWWDTPVLACRAVRTPPSYLQVMVKPYIFAPPLRSSASMKLTILSLWGPTLSGMSFPLKPEQQNHCPSFASGWNPKFTNYTLTPHALIICNTCIQFSPSPTFHCSLSFGKKTQLWWINRKEFVITICMGCACNDVIKRKPTHTELLLPFKETWVWQAKPNQSQWFVFIHISGNTQVHV